MVVTLRLFPKNIKYSTKIAFFNLAALICLQSNETKSGLKAKRETCTNPMHAALVVDSTAVVEGAAVEFRGSFAAELKG